MGSIMIRCHCHFTRYFYFFLLPSPCCAIRCLEEASYCQAFFCAKIFQHADTAYKMGVKLGQ